jgi:magnesium chelatase subunit H
MDAEARRETITSVAEAGTAADLAEMDRLLSEDHEIQGLLNALDARFIRPVAGGDLIRSPNILPTGRNLHGFDPFRIPSAFAVKDGARQAQLLLDTHVAAGKPLPETVALVLWGTDNLKSEGGPIALRQLRPTLRRQPAAD